MLDHRSPPPLFTTGRAVSSPKHPSASEVTQKSVKLPWKQDFFPLFLAQVKTSTWCDDLNQSVDVTCLPVDTGSSHRYVPYALTQRTWLRIIVTFCDCCWWCGFPLRCGLEGIESGQRLYTFTQLSLTKRLFFVAAR